MAITLGSNVASLQAQRQLFKTEQNLSSVFERLSSGQRINRASDDAAGLAISESLNTDRRVFSQAIRNLNDGLSVLNIADSTVAELSGIVIRIQELAEQAANGSLSSTQRKSLDQEAQELKDEFFRVSRSADFNGLRLFDGSIEDGVRLQAGYGEDGSIFSSLGGEMGDGTFQGPQDSEIGSTVNSATLGDLNGDGILDLVTANSNRLSVLLGRGDGRFEAAQDVTSGPQFRSVAVGDLNGDGILDIAAALNGSNAASVLLGNGDGSFQESTIFDVSSAPQSISVGDLNNDGILDIATADSGSDAASVLLGNGDGSFQAAQSFELGNVPISVTFGDLNGDGVLDLVSANYFSDDISVLLGNGDGSFQAAQTLLSGEAPMSVVLDDLNSDGILDMVTANNADDEVTVLIGNGDGTFQSAQTIAVGGNPESVITADLNGDGAQDIVSANYAPGSVSVLFGNGDGSFQSATSVEASLSPTAITSGDVNGDGVLDLVTANASLDDVSVMLGNTREGIAPILDFSLETQADALQALAPLERKLQSLSEQRGTIGAFQSRLQSALNTLSATSENYAAAESRIRDADIAFESSQLTRLNILQQAAAAVLGQANQQPALALPLLS